VSCVEKRIVWREGALLTALVDDVEGGVRDVVVFEEVFGRARERADEDRVVLWGDEGDGGKAQVGLPRHRTATLQAKPQKCVVDEHFPFWGRESHLS